MPSAVPILRRHQHQRNQANGMTSASQAHHQSTPTIKATLFGASPFRILGDYEKHHPPKKARKQIHCRGRRQNVPLRYRNPDLMTGAPCGLDGYRNKLD